MQKRAKIISGLGVVALIIGLVLFGWKSSAEAAGPPGQKVVTVKQLTDGRVSTTTTMPNGDTWTLTGPVEATDSDVTVSHSTNADGTEKTTVEGFATTPDTSTASGLTAQSLSSSGDMGCGGKTPVAAWTFSGSVDAGRWEGGEAVCRAGHTKYHAWGIDKMFMRAVGKNITIGCCDHIPDTFWVQAFGHTHTHPALLDQDPNSSISDTVGACTSYSIGIGGLGMGGSVCRGTMSPILSHAVTVGGIPVRSYGVKYEGRNLLMSGGTTYGIKSMGWRRVDRYSAATPFMNFRKHGGYRWKIDFDAAAP